MQTQRTTGGASVVAAEPSRSARGSAGRGEAREFDFSSADFERVRKLIYDYAGISLAPIKRDMVYSRLARRLRATGMQSFSDYLDRLDQAGNPEWESFVNALTTNLTSFFREPHHFEQLKKELRSRWDSKPINIWCSASSTGEEPYSLAITAIEAFESWNPPVKIFASDLDTNCLAEARRAVYPIDRVERLEADRRSRYFQRGSGAQDGLARVRPEVARLVEFGRVNLLEPNWPVKGPLEAIFCRNVMIYFDKPTQYKILSRFLPLLRENGLLFAGHSEGFTHAADLFRSIGRTVYERANGKR